MTSKNAAAAFRNAAEAYRDGQAQKLLDLFAAANGRPAVTIEDLTAWVQSDVGKAATAFYRGPDGKIQPDDAVTWSKQRDGLQGPLTKAGPLGPMTKGERPRTWPSPQRLERIRRFNSGKMTFYAREVITMLEAHAWPNQSRAFADAMDKLVGLWRQAKSKPRRI
jgi:hypothetical protein